MSRKNIKTLVCMLLACSMLSVPAFAESAVVTGSKVNVRSGPGTDYYAIASLERNTVVEIVNRLSDSWYEVNYNGINGFVSSAYLSTTGGSQSGIVIIDLPQPDASPSANTGSTGHTAAPAGSGTNTADASGLKTCHINAMYVRFRSGPGSDYSVVGEYNKGKEIKVVTTVGDWVAGYIDGNPGYVHKNYVSEGYDTSGALPTQNNQSGLVVVTPEPTDSSAMPKPNEALVVITPPPNERSKPQQAVIVLPSPDPAPSPSASPVTVSRPQVNANGVKGYIVGTYVRFRTGPGSNYSIIGTYNTGKELTAYANSGDGWLFCAIDGKEGYVHGNYVYVVPGSAAQTQTRQSAPLQNVQIIEPQTVQNVGSSKKSGYIVGNNVRFRAAASMTSQILGELFYGDPVSITGTSGEWAQIVYGDSVGYVYSSYVREGSYKTGGQSTFSAAGSQSIAAPVNASGQDIVNYAQQFLGSRYCWGGTSPDTGFDCSGFVYYVFKHFGIDVSRVAADQASNGVHVEKSDLRPGDILCFYSGSSYIGHSGIYIGGNNFIHSSNSTTGVIISELSGFYSSRGFEARRLVG